MNTRASRRKKTVQLETTIVVEDTDDDESTEMAKKLKSIKEENLKLNLKSIQDLDKQFKRTCDNTKRETQKLERERALSKPARTNRSGVKRGVVNRSVYTDGRWVTKGIDDSQEKYDAAEKEYLRKQIEKLTEVSDLKFEHVKYLIIDTFLSELKAIKAGELTSEYHNRYRDLFGKSKMDLFAEVKTSLFSNEQRDYINGLLQGAFETTTKDDNGDIKHSDINYVEIVIMAEATLRIVKYVHRFETIKEAQQFMVKSSREAIGISDED